MSDSDKSLIDEYGNIHHLSKELARGGQGVVYRTSDADLAIKQPLVPETGELDTHKNVSDIFRRVRTLPLPQNIQLSLPLAILRDEPGYVMKLLNDMDSFSDFYLNGIKRAELSNLELPTWLSGLSDRKFALDLEFYAQTGSTRRRLYSLYKCAAILARLHNAGLVYGDISANNVFIGKDIPCDCWLIDADNLRLELATGGHTVYTPKLGAPEIVQRQDASRPRTDCWAFAVMAFQILSLCEHPFIGKKVLEPDDDSGWDAEPKDEGTPTDMDELAYLGLLPYIDDDDDDSNALPKGGRGIPRQLIFTPQLKSLFQETFGSGRLQPHRRPAMTFWALELARAFDNSLVCPSCHMSFYYTSDTTVCPYCQAPFQTFALAKTSRWQKILCGDSANVFKCAIPHRLFHPFSLANSDLLEYEAEVDLENRHITSVRGTKTLPADLTFEIISANGKKEEAR